MLTNYRCTTYTFLTILGLDGFTSEDTWVLYDIGIGAVINGLALLGGYSGLSKYVTTVNHVAFTHTTSL